MKSEALRAVTATLALGTALTLALFSGGELLISSTDVDAPAPNAVTADDPFETRDIDVAMNEAPAVPHPVVSGLPFAQLSPDDTSVAGSVAGGSDATASGGSAVASNSDSTARTADSAIGSRSTVADPSSDVPARRDVARRPASSPQGTRETRPSDRVYIGAGADDDAPSQAPVPRATAIPEPRTSGDSPDRSTKAADDRSPSGPAGEDLTENEPPGDRDATATATPGQRNNQSTGRAKQDEPQKGHKVERAEKDEKNKRTPGATTSPAPSESISPSPATGNFKQGHQTARPGGPQESHRATPKNETSKERAEDKNQAEDKNPDSGVTEAAPKNSTAEPVSEQGNAGRPDAGSE